MAALWVWVALTTVVWGDTGFIPSLPPAWEIKQAERIGEPWIHSVARRMELYGVTARVKLRQRMLTTLCTVSTGVRHRMQAFPWKPAPHLAQVHWWRHGRKRICDATAFIRSYVRANFCNSFAQGKKTGETKGDGQGKRGGLGGEPGEGR